MTVPKKRMHIGSVVLVSLCTLASRLLGFVRELLFVRFLGARMISDAFLTALRIPNTFYEICAGGACGPAVLPALIQIKRLHGIRSTNQLITALLGMMLVVVSFVCLVIAIFPSYVLAFIVPGFAPEQLMVTIALLRIFLIFMWINTGTAILAEVLRADRHFFIAALGQVVVNIAFIAGLIMYYWWHLSIIMLAYWVVFGGVLQGMMHLCACCYLGYRFVLPNKETWHHAIIILKKFVPCMITSGINEIALFIELQFSSYLPVGSISLMTYASSIMRLPFGVLVHPLITVLLPELTKLQSYASSRMAFLMFEILKIILWALGPLVILIAWFSHDIFVTLYGSSQLSVASIITLQNLLLIKLCGLIFLSINYVCLQMFYVRHETNVPAMVSLATSAWSIAVTYVLYPIYGIYGIAAAGVVTTMIRTICFLGLLQIRIKIADYSKRLLKFLKNIVLQWIVCLCPWLCVVTLIRFWLKISNVSSFSWYTQGIGLWLWIAPCTLLLVYLLWFTRKYFGLKFYFF
jgi:putative peptidoglycan lipid II flippase